MKALILAAGLGTRLMPYTHDLPKALVSVKGRPMISHLIDRLTGFGIREFVVNLHHHGDQLKLYLETHYSDDFSFSFSDEEDQLLDTGGALKRCLHYFADDEMFLVHNVDVWTSLDPIKMAKVHQQNQALATLAIRQRESSRVLLFDQEMKLRGWKDRRSGEENWSAGKVAEVQSFAFSGVQIVSPEIVNCMPPDDVFSLTNLYLRCAGAGFPPSGYLHDEDVWFDLGSPERIRALEATLT